MSLKSVNEKISAALASHAVTTDQAQSIVKEADADIGTLGSSSQEAKDEFQAVQNFRNHLASDGWKSGGDSATIGAMAALEHFGASHSPDAGDRVKYTVAALLDDVGIGAGKAALFVDRHTLGISSIIEGVRAGFKK